MGYRTAISIHALREEGDEIGCYCFNYGCDFYPRPPRGGRPYDVICDTISVSISIHALREEGDGVARVGVELGVISIHALREEGDLQIG